MKILIYSANFAPEPTGIGKYSGDMAAWLAERGHAVRVVAAPPYYPAWRLNKTDAWPPYRREHWRGVDVFRAPLWVPDKQGGLARILHLLTFAASSLPVMLSQASWRPDVIITIAPAFVCAPGGWLTARLCGARAWLHVQDFEVDVAFRMGLLKGRWLQDVVLGLERWMLGRFDIVSSISQRMLDRLRSKDVPDGRIRFFPNWVDIANIGAHRRPEPYRAELGIAPESRVALFSGSLGGKQGLMIIPEAAQRLLHRQDIVFVICGDGVMKPELEAAARSLPNLKLLPLQPIDRLGDLLAMADIHLLPQSPDAEDLVLPSKLTGMLASGRPVIATCRERTEIADVVSKCGRVVPPEDSLALAGAIVWLADNDQIREEFGLAARLYAENFLALEAVLRRLESDLVGTEGGFPPDDEYEEAVDHAA